MEIWIQVIGWFATSILTTVFWVIARPVKRLEVAQSQQWNEVGSEQKEQWDAINELRQFRSVVPEHYEAKGHADQRSKQVWEAIDKLRESVADLRTLAAEQYVRRDEFQARFDALENRLLSANKMEINMLRQLIEKTK